MIQNFFVNLALATILLLLTHVLPVARAGFFKCLRCAVDVLPAHPLETLLTGLEAALGSRWHVWQGQDLAALQTNTVENLSQPQNSSFPSLTVYEPTYCRGYFVATRATPRSKFKVEHHGEKYFLAW